MNLAPQNDTMKFPSTTFQPQQNKKDEVLFITKD